MTDAFAFGLILAIAAVNPVVLLLGGLGWSLWNLRRERKRRQVEIVAEAPAGQSSEPVLSATQKREIEKERFTGSFFGGRIAIELSGDKYPDRLIALSLYLRKTDAQREASA